MSIIETNIEGLYVVEGKLFEDLRGQLLKPYSSDFFKENSAINLNFKEVWFTKSKKNVIRGMHLQVAPYECEKLVCAICGSVEDVILDLRKNSKTYGETFSIELSEHDIKSLYIPKGCAHGYKVISDNSIVMYMATEVNMSKYDVGIKWNSFGYDWKILNPILSEKDKNLPEVELGKIKF